VANIPASVDYTDRDFASIRARLFATLRTVFPEWTSENVFAFGNLLVELFAYVGDILTFYQDAQAREAFLPTATLRTSLLRIAAALGYTPATATAATADVVLTAPIPPTRDVPISNGFRVAVPGAGGTDTVFQVINANGPGYTLPAGAESITVTVENSSSATDYFDSTGKRGQEYALTAAPYLDGSCVVVASNGTFSQVDDLLDAGPSDKVYTVRVDTNDRATLRFGDSVQGVIPLGTVTVYYKTGGGAAGTVTAKAISKVIDQAVDLAGVPVTLTASNPGASTPGTSRTSNAKIKQDAPRQNRVKINSIADEDYVINVERLPEVARVLYLTRDMDPAVPENTGFLYPIPVGGSYPTTDLKNKCVRQVTVVYPSPSTFKVFAFDPAYKVANITAVIYKTQGVTAAAVKKAITTALTDFFAPTNADGTKNLSVDFGANIKNAAGAIAASIAWSDVYNVVRDCTGVRKIDANANGFLINGLRADLTLTSREFPKLGTITIIDADTGATL